MINLVIALGSEARPLIDYYGLALNSEIRGFPVYAKDHIQLVVSGVGKIQTAAATAFLATVDCHRDRSWLNVGIAGHSSLPVGTITLAHKITDHATKSSWYPPQAVKLSGTGVQVTTYDQPVADYTGSEVCDMEVAAFYPVATRFSSGELVQCCKIISDNEQAHISTLTPARVEALVADQVPSIDSNVQALSSLAGSSAKHVSNQIDVQPYYACWHFSTTQKVQLKETLRKVFVRGSAEMLHVENWRNCRSARSVLLELEQYLKSLPVHL